MLAIAGQSLIYLLTVVLARRLGLGGFEAYVVASAEFTLMVTFAPLGVAKYGLRFTCSFSPEPSRSGRRRRSKPNV